MVTRYGFAAALALAAIFPVTTALAEDDHGGGHRHGHHEGRDHDGHGHDHHDGGGFGIHFGGGGIGIHYDDGDHYDYGHHHHHSGWHDSNWEYLVPYYDRHYHGTYYRDGGINYYLPQTYVARPDAAAEPVPIEFGGYAHVDDLSARLQRLANDLCLELHYNYAHNQGFADTYRAAYEILKAAKYLRDREHQADRPEVARRLEAVDRLFHEVQSDVQGWSRRQRRQIGQGGAQTKLQALEATLHHLMHDVGVTADHAAADASGSPAGVEIAPPPLE
jgi:hypothetical protein